jgi:hypothetical protein
VTIIPFARPAISGFTFSETDSATNADITNVKVYEDNGTPGVYDGADVLVGTATWGGTNYAASGLSYTILANATRNMIVTVDIRRGHDQPWSPSDRRGDGVSGTVNAFAAFSPTTSRSRVGPVVWLRRTTRRTADDGRTGDDEPRFMRRQTQWAIGR